MTFDFLDRTTWHDTFDGIDLMFLMRPPALSNVKRDIVPALEAARASGVRHVVFLSLQGAGRNRIVPHAKIEAWLRDSGMKWTFVRPSFFMQNLSTTHVEEIRDHDEIVIPAGTGRTAFIDVADLAEAITTILIDPAKHIDVAWTLTGSSAVTYFEVATILSNELGRPITYERPGILRFVRHARKDLKMPWGMVMVTSVIYSTARVGRAAGLSDGVYNVIGRQPSTLEEFVHRERAAWIRKQ